MEETWRLHPEICAFTSEAFYEDKLSSRSGLEVQRLVSAGAMMGTGLRFLPVVHHGNQSFSEEEADQVAALVSSLVELDAFWVALLHNPSRVAKRSPLLQKAISGFRA